MCMCARWTKISVYFIDSSDIAERSVSLLLSRVSEAISTLLANRYLSSPLVHISPNLSSYSSSRHHSSESTHLPYRQILLTPHGSSFCFPLHAPPDAIPVPTSFISEKLGGDQQLTYLSRSTERQIAAEGEPCSASSNLFFTF